jgi:WD40 repeat protein
MELYTLPKLHDHDITHIEFDETGTYVASSALDGTIAVDDLRLQRLSHRFDVLCTPSCICWTHPGDSKLSLIVGSTSGTLHQITFRQDSVSHSQFNEDLLINHFINSLFQHIKIYKAIPVAAQSALSLKDVPS